MDTGTERQSTPARSQARTRLARAAVVEAARSLFLERGYATTTVQAVSDLADVPPATVYRLFTSKLGILKAVLDASIAGDHAPVPVSERPDVAALLDEPDAIALLRQFAGVTTTINQRANDVHRVLASAAASDPAAAELLAEVQHQRGEGQGRIVRMLARKGALRDGLRQRDALDIAHALMSPEVYRLLVVDRKWTPERYRTWLAATLVAQLT
jgi:AcrR family transcriptional regulator